jgi:hypothetical protein
MAIISFDNEKQRIWVAAGWAFRQVLRDLAPYAEGDSELQAALQEAEHTGSLVVDILDEGLRRRVTRAVSNMCEDILSGRRHSNIEAYHQDSDTRNLYRLELEQLRSAAAPQDRHSDVGDSS